MIQILDIWIIGTHRYRNFKKMKKKMKHILKTNEKENEAYNEVNVLGFLQAC